MVNQQGPQMSIKKDDVTTITDIDGTPILEIGRHEYTITHKDGSITNSNINETTQLVCGTVWSPMSKVPVVICSQCRTPSLFARKTHGIVAMNRAKTCATPGCGTACCPRHRKLGRDGKWRCLEHHKTHRLKNLVHPIFFESDED